MAGGNPQRRIEFEYLFKMKKKNKAVILKISEGFTLVEVLVASVIFLVIMMAVYSSFHAGIFGYKNIERTVEAYQSARQILERINLDMRNSFAFSENQTKFSGNKNGADFLTIADIYDNDKIVQDYAFVGYQFENGRLTRLCRQGKESLNNNSQIQPEELALNAVSVVFSYGYNVSGQEDIKWKDTWGAAGDSPEEQKVLPVAVKVKLAIKNKVEYNFERAIFLPLGGSILEPGVGS